MKKILTIISVTLIALSLAFFAIFLFTIKFDFRNLSTTTYREQIVEEDFSSIEIDCSTTKISIITYTEEQVKVCIKDSETEPITLVVADGVLKIGHQDNAKWYQIFDFGEKFINVYLPEKVYKSLTVDNSTGDISVNGFTTSGDINIDASTADISITNTTCANLSVSLSTGDIDMEGLIINDTLSTNTNTGDVSIENAKAITANIKTTTGDVELENFILSGDLFINTSTGDVDFNNIDCANAKINTTTGDVTGRFLTDKIYRATTSSGNIKVPQSSNGGLCEISTSSGHIFIGYTEIDD